MSPDRLSHKMLRRLWQRQRLCWIVLLAVLCLVALPSAGQVPLRARPLGPPSTSEAKKNSKPSCKVHERFLSSAQQDIWRTFREAESPVQRKCAMYRKYVNQVAKGGLELCRTGLEMKELSKKELNERLDDCEIKRHTKYVPGFEDLQPVIDALNREVMASARSRKTKCRFRNKQEQYLTAYAKIADSQFGRDEKFNFIPQCFRSGGQENLRYMMDVLNREIASAEEKWEINRTHRLLTMLAAPIVGCMAWRMGGGALSLGHGDTPNKFVGTALPYTLLGLTAGYVGGGWDRAKWGGIAGLTTFGMRKNWLCGYNGSLDMGRNEGDWGMDVVKMGCSGLGNGIGPAAVYGYANYFGDQNFDWWALPLANGILKPVTYELWWTMLPPGKRLELQKRGWWGDHMNYATEYAECTYGAGYGLTMVAPLLYPGKDKNECSEL